MIGNYSKGVRFFNAAMAFRVLARNPDATIAGAEAVSDQEIQAIEAGLAKIAQKLRGANGPAGAPEVGEEMQQWVANIAGTSSGEPAKTEAGESPIRARADRPLFDWHKHVQGDERFWTAEHASFRLRVVRVKPALYESFINEESLGKIKSRKSARERAEKEAIKRGNA